MVIFLHVENFKDKSGKSSLFKIDGLSNIINNIGHQGVVIFFTLSGFLITYLLLSEKKYTETINIKKFYIRRILRIWPLYFLIVLFGFFVFPHVFDPSYFPVKTTPHFLTKFFLTVFFMPNAVLYYFGSIFTIGVLWSIGTEEQFYLIWPHLIKKVKSSSLVKTLTIILFSVIFVKIVLWKLLFRLVPGTISYNIGFTSYHFLEYDAMIIGAITAVLYFSFKQHLKIVYNIITQIITCILICVLFFKFTDLGPYTNICYSTVYALIILNVSTNPGTIIKVRNPVFEYLGKISFGMYLYHSFSIAICLVLVNDLNCKNLIQYNLLLYISSVGLTVLISTLSYYLIEKPILNYKAGFMVIKSGSSAV